MIVGLALGVVLHMSPTPLGSAADLAAARAVAGVSINVADMDRSVDFYSSVLFFEKVSDVEASGPGVDRLLGVPGVRARVVTLRLGAERIELVQYLAPKGRPVPEDSRSNDRWFQHIAIIVNDMDQAYLWLRRHHVVHTSPTPQRLPDWNPNAGGIRAFYFKDPDGHALEILQFPSGKGDARWQRPSDPVFLGIDHTAIVVGDTEASLAFYRGALGMQVVGGSENYGPEQERLNDVAGARLRITTLRAAEGPAVELLEYLAPRGGRPYPGDVRANDLVRWHTLVLTRDAGAAAAVLGARAPVGPLATSLPDVVGFRQGFTLRDPDGHALQLRAR
ncbi:MAG: glyoxalase [Candidatus Rokuibacteriota bacterium]|nr:MAG: glyoxalase [Candidatus Rokubacteria bacterium]